LYRTRKRYKLKVRRGRQIEIPARVGLEGRMKVDMKCRRFRDRITSVCIGLTFVITLGLAGGTWAGPPDISDAAITKFLAKKFQYDYTKIIDDATLRDFINALDSQFAIIEYRQRTELVAPGTAGIGKKLSPDLEQRYMELLSDRFIFKKLNEWRSKTTDSVNRAFIANYIDLRSGLMADPKAAQEAKELAQRIADRLYHFLLAANGKTYTVDQAADIIFSGDSLPVARELYRQLNDSVAMLADDGSRLYLMYNAMGQFVGYRTSLEYHLAQLSFSRPEWRIIADNFLKVTDSAYFGWLDSLKQADHRQNIPLFEIESILRKPAALPDSFFTTEAVETAIDRLLSGFGLQDLKGRLRINQIDSGGLPAVAVRLCPPYDDLFLDSRAGGYEYYRRLASEYGRALPWAYADSALPYTVRDYPPGSEEMLTTLFETMATDSAFLARNFSIPGKVLARFETARRRLTIFQIRHSLLYFYFDYVLSQEKTSNLPHLFMALTDTLFGANDSSYQWVEVLVTGGLETAAKKLAHRFCWAKTMEMLNDRFGADYWDNPRAGEFLVEKFCRPGRAQTIEQYIEANTDDRLSVAALKRLLGM
jgi:hypothetical protein